MGLSSVQQRQQPGFGCSCKSEDVYVPIKSKMRVLKTIKKRIGLAPRNTTSCPGPNNLPPLQFHHVHGDNIRICRDGAMAKRYESFCKGITFSARPVKINERVCVKFSEISNNWSGVIRFGFTYNDPATLRNSLPKYACPDLTNKPGYWAKALNERFCERDNVLFYYVTAAGDVHFGVNGEERGVFITGVDTRSPLWTLIDIYGNCTAIEFLDSRICMHHQTHSHQQQQQQQQQQQLQQQQQQQQHQHPRRLLSSADPNLDRVINSMQQINIAEELPSPIVNRPMCNSVSIGSLNRHAAPMAADRPTTIPLQFHRTKGRNIMFTSDRFIATRADTEFCQGYVFTGRPIMINEKIIVQILRTEHMYVGALALGLTSCDPASLQQSDLPDDSDMLLDRPEYWVVSKDVAAAPMCGDEITFCVTAQGEVQISKNGGPATVVMHVDQSLQLWAFLDVYGSTQSVRILSQEPAYRRLRPDHIISSESVNSLNSQVVSQQTELNRQLSASRLISVPTNSGDMIQIQPGGTVLVVNLPPASVPSVPDISPVTAATTAATSSTIPQQQQQQQQQQVVQSRLQTSLSNSSSSTLLSNYNNAYIEPVQQTSQQTVALTPQQQQNYTSTWQDQSVNLTTGAECTICYEHPIDSVLYMCGHMCMCYECAIKQWRGIGGGHCPLCRAVIRDVIRTYKS